MEKLFIFTPIELIAAGVTAVLFLVEILYWIVTYARPLRKARKQQPSDSPEQPPVSVIVYAKNESFNLQEHLPSLLTQVYPQYEVIVVNDGSTDETDDLLNQLEQEHKHLYHTYIPEEVKYLSRKKLALTVGIKAAKYDVLLFSEANCKPISPYWIASMSCRYKAETDIVLGFCAYGDYPGFMHRFIAYDNLLSGLQWLSAALISRPFAGTGRNLSYRKPLFFKHQGYKKSLSLHAGDDDLFINEYANKKNTEVAYFADSITEMARIERFGVWKEMMVSRAATQRFYKGGRLTFYRMEDFMLLLFFLAVVASVVLGLQGNWLISVFGVLLYLLRFLAKAIVMHKSAEMLQQKPLTKWLPLLEVVRPLFNLYVRVYRIFRGKNDYTFRLR